MSISCCDSSVNDVGFPWIVSTVTAGACEDAKRKAKCVDLTVFLLTSTELDTVTLTQHFVAIEQVVELNGHTLDIKVHFHVHYVHHLASLQAGKLE